MRIYLLATIFFVSTIDGVSADTFGSGTNSFAIEFVTVRNPGNPADTRVVPNPIGSVPYNYRIGKYEISEQIINLANDLGGLGVTIDSRDPSKPATSITWYEAARFVNWLNISKGRSPAYKFDYIGNFQLWTPDDAGYDPSNRYRNQLAQYYLPTAHEWHKAAYYAPTSRTYYDYPTSNNFAFPPTSVGGGTAPGSAVYDQPFMAGPAEISNAGGLSPFGTMAQGGNVWEWEETTSDLTNGSISSNRGLRGGDWTSIDVFMRSSLRPHTSPDDEGFNVGFRVASVAIPEPSTLSLIMLAVSFSLFSRQRAII